MSIASYFSPGKCSRCSAPNSCHCIHVYGLYRRFCDECVESYSKVEHLLATKRMQHLWFHFPRHPIDEIVKPKRGDVFQWNGEHAFRCTHRYEDHIIKCGDKRVVVRRLRKPWYSDQEDYTSSMDRYIPTAKYIELINNGEYRFIYNNYEST